MSLKQNEALIDTSQLFMRWAHPGQENDVNFWSRARGVMVRKSVGIMQVIENAGLARSPGLPLYIRECESSGLTVK